MCAMTPAPAYALPADGSTASRPVPGTASLRHLFDPGPVAVIGASRRTGTVGRAVLDNIRSGGYQGRLYAVNPHASYLGGVRCVPTVAELPEAPDLAVIAIPSAGVTGAAEACGAKGVKVAALRLGSRPPPRTPRPSLPRWP
jgi:predicted CoA-binding protein